MKVFFYVWDFANETKVCMDLRVYLKVNAKISFSLKLMDLFLLLDWKRKEKKLNCTGEIWKIFSPSKNPKLFAKITN